MRKIFILMVLVLFTSMLWSETIEVSKPLQLTDSEYYERGSDICYGNGYYWLVWGQAYCATGGYQHHSSNFTKTSATGKDTGYMETEEDANGNGALQSVDGDYYEIFWKKATSIEGLVSASENRLLDTNGYRLAENAYNGEAWIEFYDNKIWVLASDTDPNNDNNEADKTIVCAYTTNGDSWTKMSSFGGYDAKSHMDIFSYNGHFCLAKGGGPWVYKYTDTPELNDNWSEVRQILGTASTARAFVDEAENDLYFVDRNFTASTLTINKLTNWDTNTWTTISSSGVTDIPGWDPCLTKYNGNFIFVSAPDPGSTYGIDPDQDYGQYISCFVGPDLTQLTADMYTLDTSSNVGTTTQNDWCAMWPNSIVDLYGANPTLKTMVIYTSERVETLGAENEIGANICGMIMEWDDLEANHTTFINTAINGSTSRLDPAVDGDVINVISGTYLEDVVIPVNLSLQGNEASIIDGSVTVAGNDATVQGFEITGALDFDGSGTVYANYNYWGSASGPEGGDITGGGDVRYIPYYTDAAMTTLGPELSVTIARTATQTTLTWTDDGVHAYTVYGSDDPDADFPGRAWTEVAGVESGTPFTSSNQFYSVVTEDWYEGATVVGFYEYDLVQGYNYIPINLDFGYSSYSDMEDDFNVADGQVFSTWEEVTQGWISRTFNDPSWEENLPVNIGDVIVFNTVTTPVTTLYPIYPSGQVPTEWATFDFTITATTDMNLVYLPLDMADCTTLGDVAASIGSQNANTISVWDDTNQAWITATYIEFYDAWTYSSQTISVGQPMFIGAVQNFTWPIR